MPNSDYRNLIELLITRLERISADSYWSHRASGVRGSLFRLLEEIDSDNIVTTSEIEEISDLGFSILEQASNMLNNSSLISNGNRTLSN